MFYKKVSTSVNILLPIESIKREIDSKLFLAVMLSSKDRVVYIGQHNVIDKIVLKMNVGIYFGKNIFKTEFPNVDLKYYHSIKKRKFNLIYLDEEGGVYPGGKIHRSNILNKRINPKVLSAEDTICSWGEFQHNHTGQDRKNSVITGHPKFDLYRKNYRSFFADEVDSIKNRFSKFILIDTMYTLANHCYGGEYAHSILSDISDMHDRILETEEWAY